MGSLILIRHSTTEASAAGRNLGQRSDLPLSEAGLTLAEQLGRTLGAELAELPHDELRLASSPALRCRMTLDTIVGVLGFDSRSIEIEPGLMEIDYGAWDGLTPEECRRRDPELRATWEADPYATRRPGGESGRDVARRAAVALAPIEGWLAESRARCAIAVAHNHVNRLRMCALLGWPMREYRERLSQDPGSYNLITFGAGAPVLRRLNVPPA
jgi:phosphoserine phosphatase